MARRPVVAYADGHDCAVSPPSAFATEPCDVVLGWVPEDRAWLAGALRGWALMGGYSLGPPIRDGRLHYVPTRISAVPHVLERLQPDVLVIPAVRRGNDLAYGRSVGWAPTAATTISEVVVEVDETAEDLGAPLITAPIRRTMIAHRPITPPPTVAAGAADLAIAEYVVSLLPPEPTLQFGPGAVADAIVRAVDRPVRVWSGLLTDAVATLADRNLLRDPAVGAYAYGGPPIVDLCRAGGARLAPSTETHDGNRIAERSGFVAVNTALQVGLDGSVNVERVRGRLVAGVGGHPDFCAAASRAPDGLSVIALRAAHHDHSSIVPRVDTVSTPRCDVDVIVTEHGAADLRGLDDAQRAERIVSVAAPEHRAQLEQHLP